MISDMIRSRIYFPYLKGSKLLLKLKLPKLLLLELELEVLLLFDVVVPLLVLLLGGLLLVKGSTPRAKGSSYL
jgi:hypothetical protein